jgi:hypothetical protein
MYGDALTDRFMKNPTTRIESPAGSTSHGCALRSASTAMVLAMTNPSATTTRVRGFIYAIPVSFLMFRRALLWALMNAVVVLGLTIGCVAWLAFTQRSNEFTGDTATGRGGLISLEIPFFLALGVLLIANLAWFAFAARKR